MIIFDSFYDYYGRSKMLEDKIHQYYLKNLVQFFKWLVILFCHWTCEKSCLLTVH